MIIFILINFIVALAVTAVHFRQKRYMSQDCLFCLEQFLNKFEKGSSFIIGQRMDGDLLSIGLVRNDLNRTAMSLNIDCVQRQTQKWEPILRSYEEHILLQRIVNSGKTVQLNIKTLGEFNELRDTIAAILDFFSENGEFFYIKLKGHYNDGEKRRVHRTNEYDSLLRKFKLNEEIMGL